MLDALQDNGGPSLTHALGAVSPAINGGDDSVLGPPHILATDQRGAGFPRLQGAHVDIGAYEAAPQGLAIPLTGDWNLGSLPIVGIQNVPVADVVAPLGSNLTRIYCYDATKPANPWGVYDPSAPPFAQSLFNIKPEEGCWFLMGTGDTLVLQGTTLPVDHTSWSLVNGWQLVGWGAEPDGSPASIASALGGKVRLFSYDPSIPANPWKIYDSSAPPFVNTLQALTKLKGYWLFYEAPPGPVEPLNGMVGWWPGDGHANDIIGSNHGILSGDATYTGGMVGQAFSLDGVDNFILVPDSANLNITGDVTVDLWAKRTVLGRISVLVDKGANVVGPADQPDAYAMWFSQNDYLVAGFARADGFLVFLVGPVVTDSQFHHYAYVRSGNTHNLFMDGVLVTADTFAGVPIDTSGLPLAIGAVRRDPSPPGFSRHFGGVIDEVEIFNRALTAAEIKNIYEAGSFGKIKPSFGTDDVFLPAAGVLAKYEFNGNVSDSGDYGRDPVLLGGDFVATPWGQGLHVFPGGPTGIDWSAFANLMVHPYTVEMVLNPQDTGGYRKIFSHDDSIDPGWYYISQGIQDWPNAPVGAGQVLAGERHYLAFVSTAPNAVDIYFQGSLLGSTSTTFTAPPTQAIFFRDDRAGNEQLDAVVDALRISGTTRTPGEIAAVQQRLQDQFFQQTVGPLEVYVMSSGNATANQAALDALAARGHLPTLGVEAWEWDSTQASLGAFDAVVLLNSFNQSSGSMPGNGQTAVINYVTSGGGLITGEWLIYNVTAANLHVLLDPLVPADNVGFTTTTSTKYSKDISDATINNGLPDSLVFLVNNVSGTESRLAPRAGATTFYSSSKTSNAGLIGWGHGDGRVISFSTLITDVELGDPDYARLFVNAMEWAGMP